MPLPGWASTRCFGSVLSDKGALSLASGKDMLRHGLERDVAPRLADDDAELALVDHAAGVRARGAEGCSVGREAVRRLEEEEWLGRDVVGAEVAGEGDHLRRRARRQPLDAGDRPRLAGRLGAGEEVAAA